jgi:hypothetical protein
MRAAILPLLLILLVSLPAFGGAALPIADGEGTFSVRLSTWRPAQGDPVFVEASPVPQVDNVVMTWKGRQFPMKEVEPGRFLGLIGVDLLEPPGKALLSLRAQRGNEAFRIVAEVVVGKRTFPVQKLTLPKEMAQFDGPTLTRINREARKLAERFSRISSPPAWSIPFLPPVAQFRPKEFGARRIINGEPRSPHAGVDVDLPAGTPVMAIADGNVAFAGAQFFGGNSVVLDHGGRGKDRRGGGERPGDGPPPPLQHPGRGRTDRSHAADPPSLVHRLANTLAFERRCIRSSFVALLATRGTLLVYSPRKTGVSPPILSRAPCWRGASTLSVLQAIYETVH